jgi:thioredoxin reductase (NADPH)
MSVEVDSSAFPKLSQEDIDILAQIANCQEFADGEYVFKAGQSNADLFVVREGSIRIVNPAEDNKLVVVHEVGQFTGDIDILTGRPVLVSGIANGVTRCCRIPNHKLREVLTKVPRLSEKLLVAFQMRRQLLQSMPKFGLSVIGYARCHHTTDIREFLHRNFVPHHFYDIEVIGEDKIRELNAGDVFPVVRCVDQSDLVQPTPRAVAVAAGIWRQCPSQKVDVAIVGAGPAGIAAAVYSASEGLSTLVLDSVGPGGQAGASSKIENFIGFPSGLSGNDLATRGILQMLKFGAQMVAPVVVTRVQPPSPGNCYHSLHLDCGSVIRARVVLIATGVKWRKLEAKNASLYERAGVYYACTAIEALLHDGEDVVVVGAGNSAGQAAMYLSECCPTRTVQMVVRGKFGTSMSEYLCTRIRHTPNIKIHEGANVTEVHGENGLINGVTITDKSGEVRHKASAVFVFIGSEPSTNWLPDDMARDEKGFVLTGLQVINAGKWPLKHREPCPLETSVPGIIAAGDVRSGSTKRVGFAVGDGSQAVSCIHNLLTMAEDCALPLAEATKV